MNVTSDIRFVMINTSHPGNIGAAARAMKNMGFHDLALVDPRIFPSGEATARASGADDILANASVHATLEEAIADCELVIGASARLRSISWPQVDPRTCAALVTRTRAKTAILFGREHSGLTNEELERCHYLLHIPCNTEYSSLNVAAALQVIAYEIHYANLQTPTLEEPGSELANGEQMESFFGHLETVLHEIHFLHENKNTDSLMRRLRRLFNRTRLEEKEIHILRGILTATQLQLKRQN